MKRLFFISMLWACQSPAQEAPKNALTQDHEETQSAEGDLLVQEDQKIPIPKGYSIIKQVEGDLDKDGIPEVVVACNTEEVREGSIKNVTRELIVYKQLGGKWEKWNSSLQALYGSRGGGMMGDPFSEMEITGGVLQIRQEGGSSWKWAITDKYQFQDGDFYLIGYASVSGAPCEYFQTADFNVSTGRVIIEKEWEDCDSEDPQDKKASETASVKGLKITLQNRHEKRVHIVTPKEGLEVFVSTGPN